MLSTVLPTPPPHAVTPSTSVHTRGKDFQPQTYTLLFCLIIAFCSLFAAFPNFVLCSKPSCSHTLQAPYSSHPRASGHPFPCHYVPQITRANERWAYSCRLLQMGKVRSNEGEGGVLPHQAAITEHAAFQRFKSFSSNNKYTWPCAFSSWVLKLRLWISLNPSENFFFFLKVYIYPGELIVTCNAVNWLQELAQKRLQNK